MSVEINLKNDALRISKYIARRCKEYPVYVNAGPGRGEDPIRHVTLGFGIDQAGWVALVFDTRPDAQFDGEWQGFIEQNEESFPDWTKALDQMLEGESLVVTPLMGRKKTTNSKKSQPHSEKCAAISSRIHARAAFSTSCHWLRIFGCLLRNMKGTMGGTIDRQHPRNKLQIRSFAHGSRQPRSCLSLNRLTSG